MTAHASIYARNPASLTREQLIEENAVLREAVRQYAEAARPDLALPWEWKLTRGQQKILLALYAANCRAISRDQLLTAVYGLMSADVPDPRILDTHVAQIRRKLREARTQIQIETARSYGYRVSPESQERLHLAIEAASSPMAQVLRHLPTNVLASVDVGAIDALIAILSAARDGSQALSQRAA